MPGHSSSRIEKVCLITGASNGLGKASALQLAASGATVAIVGRDPTRLNLTREEIIHKTGNPQVYPFCADLSNQGEVHRLAQEVQQTWIRLDVLLNNVGAFFWTYQQTQDGIEKTWALNYLNHFLLTRSLQNMLENTAQSFGEARVLELTSFIYAWSPQSFEQRQGAPGYNGVLAYAQSKRAAIVSTHELARRLQDRRVTVNVISPGLVATQIAQNNTWYLNFIMRALQKVAHPVDVGAAPIVYLTSSPQMQGITGQHFERYRRLRPQPALLDQGQALWQISEQQLLKAPFKP